MAAHIGGMESGDALLIIDMQNDFCPGGALPVADGDSIVPLINLWISAALEAGIPVFASRDWHPEGHISFKEQGGPWPPHCLQDSNGAAYHPDLILPGNAIKITKGTRFDHDQNSAFDETGLAGKLVKDGIRRLWICGLALDVCVLATTFDALRAGFTVNLIEDATKPVSQDGAEKARREMREAGVIFVRTA